MRRKFGIMIAAVIMLVAAAVWFTLLISRTESHPVSLVFQRYSEWGPHFEDGEVAFLWLTNSSDKAYALTMTGNANTFVFDNFLYRNSTSWMVNCEFLDSPSDGGTNWIRQLSPSTFGNAFVVLGPHSGMTVRVPTPPAGWRRRVAVLCRQYDPGLGPARPLASKPGILGTLYRKQLILRYKLFALKPVWLKVWSDHELMRPEVQHTPQALTP